MTGLTYVNGYEPAQPLDGMVDLVLLSGGERFPLLLTRHAAMQVSRTLNACVAVLAATPDPVIPLCELCTRFDLPKALADKRRDGAEGKPQ